MPSPIGLIKSTFKSLRPTKQPGHGPWSESNTGWCDPKPYDEVYANGMFRGYDGSVWMYYGFRQGVKVEWTKSPMDAIENQHFFVELINNLAEKINDPTQRTRRDERRKFHIQITQDIQEDIIPYEDCPPAQADYLKRMSGRYSKPVWSGYIGIQIHEVKNILSTVFTEDGAQAKWERYKELLNNPDALDVHIIQQDVDEINRVADDMDLVPLDFTKNMEDYERLTAWHGVSDDEYALPRQLTTTRFQEPTHGKSLITPKWGEITFHAVKPNKRLFMIDPISDRARWSDPMFHPQSSVVCINMRGEVRSQATAENLMSLKRTINIDKRSRAVMDPTSSITDQEKSVEDFQRLEKARRSTQMGNGMIDNVEITVATKVVKGRDNPLPAALRKYDLEIVPLIGRQPMALNNTFPTYPNPIYPVPVGNSQRSVLSNQMFGGIIAFSGILRKTSPCAPGGIILGLSEAGHEFNEIYTDVEAANKKSNVPGMIITGRPGAGKTQQMIQMASQIVYQGFRLFFLNPKPDATLKPSFDLLGGLTINMSSKYLKDNPGLMDPMFFLDDRESIKDILYNALIMATGLNIISDSNATDIMQRRAKLQTEISDRLADRRNRCSHHVIFGNPNTGTPGISDKQVREVITNKIKTSPFWVSFISENPDAHSDLRDQLLSGRPVLIEWDKSLDLPNATDRKQAYNEGQIDSILSLTTAFKYAVDIIGNGRHGGAIMCDEAWVLQASEDAMKIIKKGAREWRQHNIMLILGTQRITDFIREGDDDLTTYIARYLFMAISSGNTKELDEYFRLTELEYSKRNIDYITNAGILSEDGKVQKKVAPRAFYVDRLYGWSGGIVCGPFPDKELKQGRTDKEGEQARKRDLQGLKENNTINAIGGFLSSVLAEDDVIADTEMETA